MENTFETHAYPYGGDGICTYCEDGCSLLVVGKLDDDDGADPLFAVSIVPAVPFMRGAGFFARLRAAYFLLRGRAGFESEVILSKNRYDIFLSRMEKLSEGD